MADKAQQKKLKAILDDLSSGDSKKMLKALKSLETHGEASVIPALVDCLLANPDPVVEKEVLEFLSSLKDSSAAVEMMDVIADPTYLPIRQKLLTTIWNTKVDFSDYIDEFVEIAVDGDFMEALDCLTIIENLEGPFMEENILECQLHLKNFLESDAPRDPQKMHILSEIALKVKEINNSLTD
jgi:hypothetical protein